jgi:DNA (cytosine-5)-methyltransferase 1
MKQFKFADLCCGIGGFHIACEREGGKCIQACDIDDFGMHLYKLNYGLMPDKDMTKIIPVDEHLDLVCFGNPCQSFSTIGQRKGLLDKRGRVFFSICKYLEQTNATSFIMENVKGLVQLNKSADFKRMLKRLEGLGYTLSYSILNAKNFGVPQSRERVYVVGHKNGIKFDFSRIPVDAKIRPLHNFLDKTKPDASLFSHRFDAFDLTTKPTLTKSGFLIKAELGRYTEKRLFSSNGTIGTIMSSMSPFIYDERHQVVRNLSITELLRCQSFPTNFDFQNASRSKALKYIGNAVCVNVIQALVQEMKKQKCIILK